MRVFTDSTSGPGIACVVIGEGLIGSAVSARLRRRADWKENKVVTNWASPTLGEDLLTALEASDTKSVEIIWAAGTFGMTSDVDVDAMTSQFSSNLAAVLQSAETFGPSRVHLVSSAGALGCPSGDQRYEVIPSPYSLIKEAEERAATSLTPAVRIHRVTSVFGPPSKSGRTGVVGALVANALRTRETPLYARTVTMRNYVHADDVAEALVRATDDPDLAPTLIAAIRSHPMNEVVAATRKVVRRSVPVSYRPPRNDQDMVFNPRAVSPLVPQRPLSAGMRMVYDALISA